MGSGSALTRLHWAASEMLTCRRHGAQDNPYDQSKDSVMQRIMKKMSVEK
jgi:hypothetical protein